MLRAFIAIQLSDEMKRQIGSVQAELKREASGSGRRGKAVKIGWTQPEGIHLTLKFLGDIQETQVEAWPRRPAPSRWKPAGWVPSRIRAPLA